MRISGKGESDQEARRRYRENVRENVRRKRI